MTNSTSTCAFCKQPSSDIVGIDPAQCDECFKRLAERQLRFERSLFGRIWLWWKGAIA